MVAAQRISELLGKSGGFTGSDVVFVALSYYRLQKQQTCSKPREEKYPPGGKSPKIRQNGKKKAEKL